jgi:enamine deaminase RidA (YjgF/YER057c/UK114 family)
MRASSAPSTRPTGSYFPQNPPARTTLEAGLMIDIRVEIEAVAYKPL